MSCTRRCTHSLLALSAVTILALTIRAHPAGAQESWVRREYVDAITDDSIRAVSTKSADGYEFVVYRIGRGRVWARFRIPDTTIYVLAKNPPPVYRIDGLKPHDLGTDLRLEKLVSDRMIEFEPKWVNFVLWHGQGQEIVGTLKDLTEGKRLLIRYHIFTGGSKDVSFLLDGFDDALTWLVRRDDSPGQPSR